MRIEVGMKEHNVLVELIIVHFRTLLALRMPLASLGPYERDFHA